MNGLGEVSPRVSASLFRWFCLACAETPSAIAAGIVEHIMHIHHLLLLWNPIHRSNHHIIRQLDKVTAI
jgi:hypothetical protein